MCLSVVSCSDKEYKPTQSATPSQSSELVQETKATESHTEKPTEKLSIKARLQQGYWIEEESNKGIMVFTFDGEKLYNDYYKLQDNTYVKIDGPGYSNVCIPEFSEDTFLVYSTGGVTNEFYFTDDQKVVKSYEDEYGYVRTWTNYDSIPSAPTKKTAEKKTQMPTEPLLTNEEIIEREMWVCYSPQDVVFDVYEFNDGIITNKTYRYSNGVVTETGIIDSYMTYEIDDERIVILDESGYERIWEFTDNPDIIQYSWQEYYGPEAGPVVTQKIYHRESIPTYEEAVEERENMWVK